MKKNNLFIACLLSAMAFGTAWAVRGKFGHEQGAAWAGAIGAMGIILVAKRPDWYNRIFKITLAAAFGWGLSGMISYGMVVGYARADDFVNVYYGLLMLFVIGILYGFIGGGLFGFALSDADDKKISWALLITEMVGFALLAYGFLINQLELLMTPPRSELWAACFGACIPIGWRAIRDKNHAVLKVAVWSALGAGFGFAFGNFLQVIARSFQSPFNFWNVMEYSIGFFGGLGMAYATLTSNWPVLTKESKQSNWLPAILVFLFVPIIILDQSFVATKMEFVLESGGNESTITLFQWIAALTVLISALIIFFRYVRESYNYQDVRNIFVLCLGSYILLSFLLTGIVVHPVEQYLYIVNMIVILLLSSRLEGNYEVRIERNSNWITAALSVVIILALLSLLALELNVKPMGDVGRF
jgi:hypothetical protein